jgi:hypothetical protein
LIFDFFSSFKIPSSSPGKKKKNYKKEEIYITVFSDLQVRGAEQVRGKNKKENQSYHRILHLQKMCSLFEHHRAAKLMLSRKKN